ncbi:MAG: phosphopantothenoylcysteine decarboxylase [Bacteroidia bacterium]|nr:phosphopantothenoylcysteine decarboxylase [Bacteroidia bacterium]
MQKSEELIGKKVLVTAGATYEPIDPVRFIGNRSSGKTGAALAEEFYLRGAEVYLIYGNIHVPLPTYSGIKKIYTPTAQQMFDVCVKLFTDVDMAVLAAAVADYTPIQFSTVKIKKEDGEMTLHLKKTPDILKTLGEQKKQNQILAGFALETNCLIENAQKKLTSKNADVIFANICSEENPAFHVDENEIVALFKNNQMKKLGKNKKYILAEKMVDELVMLLHDKI